MSKMENHLTSRPEGAERTRPDGREAENARLAGALASARDTREVEMGARVLARGAALFGRQFGAQAAAVIADPTTYALAGAALQEALSGGPGGAVEPHVFATTELVAATEHVDEVTRYLQGHEAIPVAVGSGTINDIVKLAAHRVGRPYLCVPTAASMDGYTAFGASILHEGAKQTFHCPAPQAVLVDVELIGRAPWTLTAAGYADLQAKITAGADWLVAAAMDVEAIDVRAWELVQGNLAEALANPGAARAGEEQAIRVLVEGLLMGGFAMQWTQSSRPASGAEHQFSHLWDMEHHRHEGGSPAHGYKVGVATLAVAALFEQLLDQPLDRLDVEERVATWRPWEEVEPQVRDAFADTDFQSTALAESEAKHGTAADWRHQLTQLRERWPLLQEQLRAQLVAVDELKRRLVEVGAPVEPEQIGISRSRLRTSFQRARCIRRRFTVLDLAERTGQLEPALGRLFGPGGRWDLSRNAAGAGAVAVGSAAPTEWVP